MTTTQAPTPSAVDVLQPGAPRIGGITPYLRLAGLAEHRGLQVAPHLAMEVHLHPAAAYPAGSWVEHFDWLEPLLEERPVISGGLVHVPDRPGLGLTLSEQARAWTVDRARIDAPPIP